MMTPRGVADVQVYTPERVELRYGVRPDQVPDFIGLKGDTSRQHPRRPRHRRQDRRPADRAVRLARGGDRARRRAVARARRRRSREHADQARASKLLATMRRDLALDVDPTELVLAPPDRSQLKEIFRRFEFRDLLEPGRHARRGAARRGAARSARAQAVPWREGELAGGCAAASASRVAGRSRRGRHGRRGRRRRLGQVADCYAARRRALVAHDAKALRLADPRRRRHDDRRVPDRARPRRVRCSTTSRRSTASSSSRTRRPRRRRPRSSATPRPRAASRRRCRERVRERGSERLYRDIELPLTAVLAAMEDAGVRIDTYRMGEITARLSRPRRGARGAARTSSRARSSCSARPQQLGADPVREARADARPQGEDGLLDRQHACSARSAPSTRSSR